MSVFSIKPAATSSAHYPAAIFVVPGEDYSATGGIADAVEFYRNTYGATQTLSAGYLCAGGALTANDTNYAGWTIYSFDGDTSVDVIGTVTTKITGGTGDWTQSDEFVITLDVTTLAAGHSLRIGRNKAAAGVVCPGHSIVLEFVQP